MARPLRLEFPGALYHLTSRGDGREDVFLTAADREAFLQVLTQVVERFAWLCHAYCLMDNHYHLLVETPQANLSRGMRQLNGVYTQAFNRAHGRVGHVFQGRFKSILVEKESHLLELARYIVQNPVRARSVRRAVDWPWSSYRATAGLEAAPSFLTVDWILGQFGRNRRTAQEAYREFVAEGRGASPWDALVGQVFLGSERFVRRLQAKAGPLSEVPRRQRTTRPPLATIFARGPVEKGIVKAYREHSYTLKEIADYHGVHYATVSRRLRRAEEQLL
jgi:REP element-mobilizing transposase RayT/plasmid stabilization system protein ParE